MAITVLMQKEGGPGQDGARRLGHTLAAMHCSFSSMHRSQQEQCIMKPHVKDHKSSYAGAEKDDISRQGFCTCHREEE